MHQQTVAISAWKLMKRMASGSGCFSNASSSLCMMIAALQLLCECNGSMRPTKHLVQLHISSWNAAGDEEREVEEAVGNEWQNCKIHCVCNVLENYSMKMERSRRSCLLVVCRDQSLFLSSRFRRPRYTKWFYGTKISRLGLIHAWINKREYFLKHRPCTFKRNLGEKEILSHRSRGKNTKNLQDVGVQIMVGKETH